MVQKWKQAIGFGLGYGTEIEVYDGSMLPHGGYCLYGAGAAEPRRWRTA